MRLINLAHAAIFILLLTSFSFAQVSTLDSPADSTIISGLPVTLSWSWSYEQPVTQYHLQVDSYISFNSPVIDSYISSIEISESFIADQPLLYDHNRYFWRVQAYYMVGPDQYEWSDWSEDWLFTVNCQGFCGDANGDSRVNVADVVYILNYVFLGGDPPRPVLACGNSNSDIVVNVSDAVYLIGCIFVGGICPGDCLLGFDNNSWPDGDCCEFVFDY